MTEWRFIDSGPCPASYNMAVDEAIAITVRKAFAPPTLRVYGWARPSVSLGSFQKITDVDAGFCAANSIAIVRRPTGGRAILHHDELTYSFSSGNDGFFAGSLLDSYRLLSTALKSALETLGLSLAMKGEREPAKNLSKSPLCFRSTSYGEITFEGKKLVGSAQKRWSDGFLQQGSIPFAIDRHRTRTVFSLEISEDLEHCIIGLRELLYDFEPQRLKEMMRDAFSDTFGVKLIPSFLSREEDLLARELELRKYRSQEWTAHR